MSIMQLSDFVEDTSDFLGVRRSERYDTYIIFAFLLLLNISSEILVSLEDYVLVKRPRSGFCSARLR